MKGIKGTASIFYIVENGVDIPVACLTSNPFSESAETLDTTTRENGGWKTSLPTMQEYGITLNGLMAMDDPDTGNNVFSFRRLRQMKRERKVFHWKIKTLKGWYIDYGKAVITEISFDDPADGFITFSATLQGWGRPDETFEREILSNEPKTLVYTNKNALITTTL